MYFSVRVGSIFPVYVDCSNAAFPHSTEPSKIAVPLCPLLFYRFPSEFEVLRARHSERALNDVERVSFALVFETPNRGVCNSRLPA